MDGRRLGGEYAQEHKPIRKQTEAGHAIRASYWHSGMTDVGVPLNDQTPINAGKRLLGQLFPL